MIQIWEPSKHHALVAAQDLVDLHIACIEQDGAIMTFLPPFDREKMVRYWQNQLDAATVRRQTLIISLESEKLAGCVILEPQDSESGKFRANVAKLMVSPDFRRRGIARGLMGKLEDVAREKGRTLLLLDTIVGSAAADKLYPSLGYIECGKIPWYGIHPVDGSRHTGVWFYKHLVTDGEAEASA